MFAIQSIVDYIIENLGTFTLFVVFVSLVIHIANDIKIRRRLPRGPTGLLVVLPILNY